MWVWVAHQPLRGAVGSCGTLVFLYLHTTQILAHFSVFHFTIIHIFYFILVLLKCILNNTTKQIIFWICPVRCCVKFSYHWKQQYPMQRKLDAELQQCRGLLRTLRRVLPSWEDSNITCSVSGYTCRYVRSGWQATPGLWAVINPFILLVIISSKGNVIWKPKQFQMYPQIYRYNHISNHCVCVYVFLFRFLFFCSKRVCGFSCSY